MLAPVLEKKQLHVSVGGYSTAGLKAENQDAFVAHFPTGKTAHLKGGVACIADGVSCSDSAQLASQTSVTTFVEDYFSTPETWPVKTAAARVLSALNAWLYQHGQLQGARHNGLVTTFSSLVFKSTTAHLLHVGDSRVYRFRKQGSSAQLEQLSRDHCHQQGGEKTFLTRALGMDSHLEVDYQQEDLEVGDVFLLSSDGVHEYLSTQQKKDFLSQATLLTLNDESAQSGELEALAKSMCEQALAQGSDDNLSCLLLRVNTLPAENLEEVQRKLSSLNIPPALDVGNRIDQYEVQKVLHAGSRSHVYLAKDTENDSLCVLKMPSENFSEDVEFLEAFVREQWVASKIDHPAAMKLAESRAGSSPFLYHAYEYIEGKTLRQWMYDNPEPDLEAVRDICEQIISVLRAFQRLSMVHRDLKPENILLDMSGRVRIIDFGTVQVNGLDEIASPISEAVPVGAVDYIAPEYLLGEKGRYGSDLFSLGVIAYEMLTGALPYQSPRVQRVSVRDYEHWQYRSAMSVRSDIPLWLDLALQKATAPKPSQRYAALSEFLQDLKTPNREMLSERESAPLLERDPLSFWKWVSGALLIVVLVQLWLLHQT